MPLINDNKFNKLDTLEFIQNRLHAIRCEYHVQNYFDPNVYNLMARFHVYVLSHVRDMSELRTTMDTYLNENLNELLKRPFLVLCMLLL
jgi:hypothetical protein